MAIQTIRTGSQPNDGTGDPARTAFGKVNDNFTELVQRTASAQETGNAANTNAAAALSRADTAREEAAAALDRANQGVGAAAAASQAAAVADGKAVAAKEAGDTAGDAAAAANNNAESRIPKSDRGAANGVTPLVAGRIPLEHIPAGIPASSVSGVAALSSAAFTGPVSVTNDTTGDLLTLQSKGSQGVRLKLTGNGEVTPSKTVRVQSGELQVVSHSYATVLLALNDAGAMSIPGAITASGAQINGNLTVTGATSGITKAMVGLGNVDNTADSAKPVSTAQQTALNAKMNVSGGTFSGDITANTVQAKAGLSLNASGGSSQYSPALVMQAGQNGYRPLLRSNATSPVLPGGVVEFINSANTAHTLSINDAGVIKPFKALHVDHQDGAYSRVSLTGYGTNLNECISMKSGTNDAFSLVWRRPDNNVVGSIAQTASGIAFNTVSDERLKDKFREFDAYTVVDMVAVYEHEFVAQPGIKHYGVKAAELQQILPGTVTGRPGQLTKDGLIDPQQVDYSRLVPIVVRHAQQTASRIRDLEAIVATQNDLLESFEKRLAALEN